MADAATSPTTKPGPASSPGVGGSITKVTFLLEAHLGDRLAILEGYFKTAHPQLAVNSEKHPQSEEVPAKVAEPERPYRIAGPGYGKVRPEGGLAKSAFTPRAPPLWSYIEARVTSTQPSPKITFFQLKEDQAAYDSITDELRAVHRQEVPCKDSLSRNDLLENETLVSAIVPTTGVVGRALVTKVYNKSVALFFLDTGHSASIRLKDVQPLMSRKALRTGQTAVACRWSNHIESVLATGVPLDLDGWKTICLSPTQEYADPQRTIPLYQVDDIL